MTTIATPSIAQATVLKAGFVVAALGLLILPGVTYAASYAYVNQAGDVSMIVAETPSAALMTAPNISTHSGVMLLDSAEDLGVVGDSVDGA